MLVVANLLFPIIIGTDILRPHAATVSVGDSIFVRLNLRIFDIFLEQTIDEFSDI